MREGVFGEYSISRVFEAMIVCIIVLPFSAAPARPFERVSASGARIFWLVVLLMFGVVIVWMALRLLLELLLLP